jgi:hypothetical protein
MLLSVAALNPTRRFRSSVASLKRFVPVINAQNGIQQLFKEKNRPCGGLRHFSSQSSQLEYDSRVRASRSYDPVVPHIRQVPVTKVAESVLKSSETIPVEIQPEVDTSESKVDLNITVVTTVERAKEVLKIMYEQHARDPLTVWACDTEVADIDLSEVGKS